MKVCLVSTNETWLKFARKELVEFEPVVTTDPQEFSGDVLVVDARCLDLLERGYSIPAVVVSGQPDTEEAVRAYRAGAIEYLAMDLTEGILWNVTRWWIGRATWKQKQLS